MTGKAGTVRPYRPWSDGVKTTPNDLEREGFPG
jgi:hypothetical protein